MRFAARCLAVSVLLGAVAATPARASVPYCVLTVSYKLPVAGTDTRAVACGTTSFVHCESVGTADVPPTLNVKVCVPA